VLLKWQLSDFQIQSFRSAENFCITKNVSKPSDAFANPRYPRQPRHRCQWIVVLNPGCVRNRIFQFVSLGEAPQDKKYADEPTELIIGDRNVIREFCTFNRGTVQDAGATRIGNDNWIMAYVHLAHDCQVGNNTIFANNSQLAGHVHVGDHAILGGFTMVHQFVHIGAHCMTAIATVLLQDLPPYVMVSGNPAKTYGINSEGLKRRGFSSEKIAEIKRAYKTLYKSGLTLAEAKVQLESEVAACPELGILVTFLETAKRGIVR